MSMRSSHVYGYGFHCDCEDQKIIEFIKSHKKTFCKSEMETDLYNEMLEYTAGEYDLEDFFMDYSCTSCGAAGIGAVISNIMTRETGVRFEFHNSQEECDTKASVLYGIGYPWQLNETEKELTEEKLENICSIYMQELGIPSSEMGYLELEYYG